MKPSIALAIVPLCTAALAAEVLLPWGLVWLSDRFLFDIPGRSLWVVFAGPPGAAASVWAWCVIVRHHSRHGESRQAAHAEGARPRPA